MLATYISKHGCPEPTASTFQEVAGGLKGELTKQVATTLAIPTQLMAPSPMLAAKRLAVCPREPGSSFDAMNRDGSLISYIGSSCMKSDLQGMVWVSWGKLQMNHKGCTDVRK